MDLFRRDITSFSTYQNLSKYFYINFVSVIRMLKRPKPGETEEDLLRFQEEFLASQAAPAAKLIKRDHKQKPNTKVSDAEKSDSRRDVVDFGGMYCSIQTKRFFSVNVF